MFRLLLTIGLITTTADALALESSYRQARRVRLEQGHRPAQALYQDLLQTKNEYGSVPEAATWIAASPLTPSRHDEACQYKGSDSTAVAMKALRALLEHSHYDMGSIQTLLGIPKDKWAAAPVYIQPCMAGQGGSVPLSDKQTSLDYLVRLFLLGLTVPREVLCDSLEGGADSVQLLQDWGLIFPEADLDSGEAVMIPYVHLVPVSLATGSTKQTMYLATDLHPRALSSTIVGTQSDGTVMYIGPDSLALVQQLPLLLGTEHPPLREDAVRILDLCTGSGIQALAALLLLEETESSNHHHRALCVDVNPRALRFVQFNAGLNGLQDQVHVLQGDLLQDTCWCNHDKASMPLAEGITKVFREDDFHVVLANPPFIPVPPSDDKILQRYGLFSSGGSSGEEVLQAIVQLAPRILCGSGGVLGVVSEFMNPPRKEQDQETEEKDGLLQRLETWWSQPQHKQDTVMGASGVLFTNEIPVKAELYATRRADSEREMSVWLEHLVSRGINYVSPGLLLIKTLERTPRVQLQDCLFVKSTASLQRTPRVHLRHHLVPKTNAGSVWTPSNQNAVEFIKPILKEILYRGDK